jgi:hypothetical protein
VKLVTHLLSGTEIVNACVLLYCPIRLLNMVLSTGTVLFLFALI